MTEQARSTASRSATVTTRPERRRHQRFQVEGFVVLKCPSGQYEGSIENLSYTGILLQCEDELPHRGEECTAIIYLPAGQVQGRGRIARVDAAAERFAVDLEHVDVNGDLLLAALVTAGLTASS